MKKISILQLILVAAMLVGATACKKKHHSSEGALDSAGDSVHKAASDTADATEEAAEDTGDKIEEATGN